MEPLASTDIVNDTEASLSVLFEPLQSLQQSISKRFSVSRTEGIQQRVNSLVILAAQTLIDLIKDVAHNLRNNKQMSIGEIIVETINNPHLRTSVVKIYLLNFFYEYYILFK